jgi:hypothetical protein
MRKSSRLTGFVCSFPWADCALGELVETTHRDIARVRHSGPHRRWHVLRGRRCGAVGSAQDAG